MAAKAAPSALCGCDTSNRRWLRCWQRCPTTRTQSWILRTTAYGHRGQSPAPGRRWSATYNVPRHQKTPPPGKRPEPHEEVSEPQVGAVTVGYVAAPEPLLVVPSMAGGDSVDGITLKVTLAQKQKEEEEEERRQAVQALTDLFSSRALSSSSRRRKKKKRKTSSHCFSLGVWVLPEEYMDSSLYSPHCLVLQWCSCLGPGCLFGRIPHNIYVKVVLALYALGNLDFPRATGISHPLFRCLSRRRSTGKIGVFWEMTTRNYSYDPLYLAVTGAVLFLLLA